MACKNFKTSKFNKNYEETTKNIVSRPSALLMCEFFLLCCDIKNYVHAIILLIDEIPY